MKIPQIVKRHPSYSVAFILLLFTQLACRTDNGPSFYLGGVQVNEPDQDDWAETLDQSGMNTVATTVYCRQASWDSDSLWFDAADTSVIGEIRAAKSQGLNVVLVLRTLLDSKFPENEFLWHGLIAPQNDEQVKTWFERYSLFAGKWAGICEREGVDILVLASELNSLTATTKIDSLPLLVDYYTNTEKQLRAKQEMLAFADSIEKRHLWVRGSGNYETPEAYIDARQNAHEVWAGQAGFTADTSPLLKINERRQLLLREWVSLIKGVREIYSGQLSYAANFDSYQEVAFWQHLDFIGINAYFKLRNEFQRASEGVLKDSLRVGWKSILTGIDDFRQAQGISDKEVIFTELGYTYRRHSTFEPWQATGFSLIQDEDKKRFISWEDQPIDFQERALAINALYEANREFSNRLLRGLLYWKLSTKDYHLPHEPFMVHVGTTSQDPSLAELTKFLN